MRMVIKAFTLALACTLIISVLLPVTANAAENSAWVELLETQTVNDYGDNLFTLAATSGSFRIKTPQYMRLTKVDMLITHPSGKAPTAVNVRYNGVLYKLQLAKLDDYTTRAYGANIPNTLYADIYFQFTKTGTASVTYQILSCRVSAVETQDFQADAEAVVRGSVHSFPSAITVPGVTAGQGVGLIPDEQIRIDVYDWMKFDMLTIWGSSLNMPITSIRATLGTKGLSITVSYMENTSAGYWTEDDRMVSGSYDPDALPSGAGYYEGEEWSYMDTEAKASGKWLYCITIDLTGVDRTATTAPLYLYLTGMMEDAIGYTFTAQYVSGSIFVADTTEASWWKRFTTFMTDLLGGDSTQGDQFADQMQEQSQQMQEAVNQMEEVTRPAVDDIEVSLDAYVDDQSMEAVGEIVNGFLGNPLVLAMVMISLVVSLAAYVIFGKH